MKSQQGNCVHFYTTWIMKGSDWQSQNKMKAYKSVLKERKKL